MRTCLKSIRSIITVLSFALALGAQAALACCTSSDDCFVGFHCYAAGDCNVIVPRFGECRWGNGVVGPKRELGKSTGAQKANASVANDAWAAGGKSVDFTAPQASFKDKTSCFVPSAAKGLK